MKKVLSLFMSIVMLLSITTGLNLTANAEDNIVTGDCGKYGDNVTYSLDIETGILTISGTGDMKDDSHIFHPNAYGGDWRIKSVIIEDGVTSISGWLFWECYNITSVAIPDTITKIG